MSGKTLQGQRKSARLAQIRLAQGRPRRSVRIAGGLPARVQEEKRTGWLGNGWYKAEILEHQNPPCSYHVKWIGYHQTDWVIDTHVTPLAVDAYWPQHVKENFPQVWKGSVVSV